MSHYKPYPAYKDSGVEWIGRVPEHWETLRIKRVVQVRNERRNDSPVGWTYIGLEDVASESGRYMPTVGSSRQSEDSMVGVFLAGDVLYGKLRPYLRKAIVAEQDGVCSTEFLVLSEGRVKGPWLHRWLLTHEVTQQIEAGCDGAKMPRADWEHVGSLPMPVPPATEQTAIAAALDRETARIDALIAKKTRFIELLKEKRQALITHAVTKGLSGLRHSHESGNPESPATGSKALDSRMRGNDEGGCASGDDGMAVPMKDSGVEWIGAVPEHWTCVPIRRVAQLESGHTPSRLVPAYWENCTIPWFTLSDIWQVRKEGRVVVTETTEKVSELGVANSSARKLPAGTVILSRTASVGFPAIMGCEMATSQDFAAWICSKRLDNQFLYLALKAMRQELGRLTMGSTHKTIYMPDIEQLRCPLPPIAEQRRIVASVVRSTARIDSLGGAADRSITLLKERRSALITAAVTGQIDLRDAALPGKDTSA